MPSGLSRACRRSLSASIPTAPRYIGASTCTSRIGSTPKRFGARSATTSTTVSSARSGLGRSMKKKSWSWSAAGSRCGGRPWLISWAAVVIIERAAWRKIWLSRTTGATPEAIRSSNGLAGADRRQLVGVADEDDVGRLGEARRAAPRSGAGSASRTRRRSTRSTGSGWPGLKAGSRPGIHSSMRWIVCASCPVASSSRRAARPVGAQRAIVAFGRLRLGDDLLWCRRSCRRRGRRSGPRSARRRRRAPPPTARRSARSRARLAAARGRGGGGRRRGREASPRRRARWRGSARGRRAPRRPAGRAPRPGTSGSGARPISFAVRAVSSSSGR